jgi:adenylate cyclase
MSAEGYKRKLTAILSAGVQGCSRLMGDNETQTGCTLTIYREAITNLIQDHHGRVLVSPGDNLLAEFTSVVQAAEIQKNLKVWNWKLPDKRKLNPGLELSCLIPNCIHSYFENTGRRV